MTVPGRQSCSPGGGIVRRIGGPHRPTATIQEAGRGGPMVPLACHGADASTIRSKKNSCLRKETSYS